MKWAILGLIRFYQVTIAGLMPNVCRYSPSCSHYAYEAVLRHGVLKGGWMGFRRIGRCRPGGGKGYDPVPQ